MVQIEKVDWVREVTEDSNNNWVVAYLFKDGVAGCSIMHERLAELADRHRDVKFVMIRSTSAVENWPDSRLPTLFMYEPCPRPRTPPPLPL